MRDLEFNKDMNESLLKTYSLPEFDLLKIQLKQLYKMSGKSKEERHNNRMLFMF